MTRSTCKTTGRVSAQALAAWMLTFMLALVPAVTRADTSLQVGIAPPGAANESNPTAFLIWAADAGNQYLVQSSTNLANPAAWTTEDAVSQTNVGPVKWMAPEALRDQKYYRLILPSPQIFSVEPAVVAPGVPVDFYVLGQGFGSNVVLQINGVTQSNAVVVSSSAVTVPAFTPDVVGTYLVSVVINGVVVSSFTVTCADALANPELVLQGPPTEPPASPSKKDFKGHVTLMKAFDDGSDDNLEGKKDFKGHVTLMKAFDDGSDGELGRKYTKTGHVTLMKAFDDGSDDARKGISPGGSGGNGGAGGNATGGAKIIGGGGGETDKDCDGILNAAMAGKINTHAGEQCDNGIAFCKSGEGCGNGIVSEQDIDHAIEGRGLDFVWARTYNSRIGRAGDSANGWTFSYDVRCVQNSSGGMDVYDGTGRKDTFTLQTNGIYTCPEFFREGTFSNTTFTLTFADTGRWVFNPTDDPAAAGKLHQIITRNGDTMTLGYDTSGRLVQVVDDLDRTNTMACDASGLVTNVTDFTGRSVTYQYYSGDPSETDGSAGDLKSVTSPPVTGTPNGNDFPDGKTTTYTYSTGYANDAENHLLLTVTDPKGQLACQFTYEHNPASPNYLHCIAAQAGTNTPTMFSYLPQTPSPSNHFAVMRCVMNDPVGNVTESFFDSRNRCVVERDYTGRATTGDPVTDTVNRPTGKLRDADSDYYETRWSWNNDSLCTSETSPGGQQMQYVYQSDFDPATLARKRADCRVVREIASSPVDLDGDGVPDVTDRAWYYTYDPRFGSDPTARDYCVQYRETDFAFGGGDDTPIESLELRESPTKQSLRESPTKQSLRLRESPTKQSLGLRESPTRQDMSAARLLPTVNKRTGIAMELFFDTYEDKDDCRFRLLPTVNKRAINTNDKGALARSLPSLKIDPYTGADFVTSATDPRGNETTGAYDANGNRVKVKFYWDRQSGAEEDFAYGSHGQLSAITNAPDANDYRRVDTFSYYTSGSQSGYVQSIAIDEPGVHLTSAFEYDTRGNLTRYTNPRTNDWLFTYNSLDQCVQAQSPTNISARCATDFAYDANDNLVQVSTEVRDAGDNLVGTSVARASYDSLHLITEVTLPMDKMRAQTNRFVYDGNNQCVQVLGPDAVSGTDPHQTMSYEYDERDLPFHEIAAAGSSMAATNEYDYDSNGNTARVNKIEAIAIKHITISRDGFDRPASITDPMGNQTFCFYDANDNPKVVRLFGELNDVAGSAGNVRLAESHYEYDGLDRCFRAHDLFFNLATQSPIGSGDAVSSCVYAPNDECVSVTDSLGRTTSLGYDTACRLSSVTDARGNQVACVRDQAGNVISLTSTELPDSGNPQVFSTTYAYDHFNRCVSSSDNVANTSTCAYDSLSHVVRATNPNGNDTTYAYDLLDNCLACVNYAGSSMFSGGKPPIVVRSNQATYDTSSRCLTAADANGNTTSYAYDTLGNCTAVIRADGTQQQLVWSPRNNLIEETDPNGTTITNTYDLREKIVHRDIAARNALATTTFETFAYDGCGRLVLASNDVSQLTFSYDSFGDCTGSSQDGLAQSATFDSEGNQLSLTYPGGRVVNHAYDVLNQVTNISTAGGGISHPQLARFAYAGPGRLAGIARDNGVNTRITWNGLVNPANSTGDHGWQQVSSITDGSNAAPASVVNLTGTYSPTQSKLTRADAGRSLTLTYDPLEQLVESALQLNGVPVLDTMYALDAAGNRQHVITNSVLMTPDYAMSSTLPPGDFQMNRYTTTPFGPQTYDANGNLIVRADAASPKFYQYDYADRLVEVDGLDTNGLVAPLATFSYDALGNRISKTTYPPSPLGPVTTQYIHNNGEQCDNGEGLEHSHETVEYKDPEDMTTRYRPGNNIIEERVGTTVSRTYCDMTAFTAAGEPQYYHCDDLGNVLALTDAGGNVLERYAYPDYGQPQFLAADGSPLVDSDGQPVTTSPLDNRYLFHGMEWDGESGLLGDGGGNYFDPLTARAIRGKVKSIKDMGNNGRAFEGNNPWSGAVPSAMKTSLLAAAKNKGKKEITEPVVYRPSTAER